MPTLHYSVDRSKNVLDTQNMILYGSSTMGSRSFDKLMRAATVGRPYGKPVGKAVEKIDLLLYDSANHERGGSAERSDNGDLDSPFKPP